MATIRRCHNGITQGDNKVCDLIVFTDLLISLLLGVDSDILRASYSLDMC